MGREEGRKAGVAHACKIMVEISREKVTAMRKMFAEISTVAGREAGVKAARAEVMKSVEQVAIRAAAKAAREVESPQTCLCSQLKALRCICRPSWPWPARGR